MTKITVRLSLYAATALSALCFAQTASAQSADAQINQIEQQIKALQSQLTHVRHDLAARDSQVKAAQADVARARADAQASAAQADAARARVDAQAAQVAASQIKLPAGFKSGTGSNSKGLDLGLGASNPMIKSPRSDFTSLVALSGNPSGEINGDGGPNGTFHIGGITIQLGGFIEAAGIYRSRNEVTSVGTNFSAIPLSQSVQAHEGEFRETSQQSRFSMLMKGDIDPTEHVAAYAELDLLGAAGTANSNESNSYTPRLRQAYMSYDNDTYGVHLLAGQAWSLVTMSRLGVTPRQEDIPLTIDAQYVPGFSWARQPQFRIAKDFDNQKFWLAASLESPQATFSVGPNGTGSDSGTANFNNPGISQLTPGQAFSNDIAPDVVVKVAADPGYGHYEVYGLARFLQDRVSVLGNGHNNTRLAGGIGGGTILPLIPNALSFELHGLAGYGIGRYGSGQLPDATISASGAPSPLPEVQAMAGLVGHPAKAVDLYTYVGTEQIGSKSFNVDGKAFGFGNPLFSNAGCDVELSTAPCTADTSGLVQGTIGGWWRFASGAYGTVEGGAQYSYTRRTIFKGVTAPGGGGNAATDENVFLVSLRYLPFQ